MHHKKIKTAAMSIREKIGRIDDDAGTDEAAIRQAQEYEN